MRSNNRIVDNISAMNIDRWGNSFALIELKTGEILFDSNIHLEYVYFPIDCIISLCIQNYAGQNDGFVLIGNEGMAGVNILLGDANNEYRANVAYGGRAYRLSVDVAMKEVNQPSQFRTLILRYLQALVASSLQTAICDNKHKVLERLCCALLICDDRRLGKTSHFTPHWLTNIIGATNDELAELIREFNNQSLLETSRGKITIANRMGLEKMSCECYRLIKNEYDHQLPASNPKKL